jgi:hypothetical protein
VSGRTVFTVTEELTRDLPRALCGNQSFNVSILDTEPMPFNGVHAIFLLVNLASVIVSYCNCILAQCEV